MSDHVVGIRMTGPAMDSDYSSMGELIRSNEKAPRFGPGRRGELGFLALRETTYRRRSVRSTIAFTWDRCDVARLCLCSGNCRIRTLFFFWDSSGAAFCCPRPRDESFPLSATLWIGSNPGEHGCTPAYHISSTLRHYLALLGY
jgi:hypothetical protein